MSSAGDGVFNNCYYLVLEKKEFGEVSLENRRQHWASVSQFTGSWQLYAATNQPEKQLSSFQGFVEGKRFPTAVLSSGDYPLRPQLVLLLPQPSLSLEPGSSSLHNLPGEAAQPVRGSLVPPTGRSGKWRLVWQSRLFPLLGHYFPSCIVWEENFLRKRGTFTCSKITSSSVNLCMNFVGEGIILEFPQIGTRTLPTPAGWGLHAWVGFFVAFSSNHITEAKDPRTARVFETSSWPLIPSHQQIPVVKITEASLDISCHPHFAMKRSTVFKLALTLFRTLKIPWWDVDMLLEGLHMQSESPVGWLRCGKILRAGFPL